MENWYIVNEKLFNLEKKIQNIGWDNDLKKEWNELVIYSRKIPGCLNRKTYEEIKEGEETRDRVDVEGISGRVDEEKA
jgi:hypothetical protein